MKCPACNNEIPYGKICPYCKKDIILTKKIIDLSNTFYNHALTFTKNNELSFAIIYLKKVFVCIKIILTPEIFWALFFIVWEELATH